MPDSSSDRDGPDKPAKSPKSAAERMRDLYWRDKEKKQSKRTNYTTEYLNKLVSDGRIRAEELDDPDILGSVIEDIYDCRKRGTFRPGPIVTGTATS